MMSAKSKKSKLEILIRSYGKRDLRAGPKTLLLLLSTYATPDGTSIFPCIKRMAAELGRARSTIFEYLKSLKNDDFLFAVGKKQSGVVEYNINTEKLGLGQLYKPDPLSKARENTGFVSCVSRTGGVRFPDANQSITYMFTKQQHRDSQVSRAPENNLEVSALPKKPLPTIPEEPVEKPKPPVEKPVEKPRPKPRANASGCCDEKLEQEVGHCIVDTPETNTEAQEPIQNEKDIQTHQDEFKNDSRAREEVDIKTAVQRVIDSGPYRMSEDGQSLVVHRYNINLYAVNKLIDGHGEEEVIQQLKALVKAKYVVNATAWLRDAVKNKYQTNSEVTPTEQRPAYHDTVDVSKYDMTLSQEERELSSKAKSLHMLKVRSTLRNALSARSW